MTNKKFTESSETENEALLNELAKIPTKLGFKGKPSDELGLKSLELSHEQKLRLALMMQEPIENIEAHLTSFFNNVLQLANAFNRKDVVELIYSKALPSHKMRPTY